MIYLIIFNNISIFYRLIKNNKLNFNLGISIVKIINLLITKILTTGLINIINLSENR